MAEARLNLLKIRKANIRRKVTKIINYFESIDVETVNVHDVELRVEIVGKTFDEFDDVQTEIEVLSPDLNFDEERDVFDDRIFKAIALGRELVAIKKAASNVINSNSTLVSNESVALRAAGEVRLPELELPVFLGDYEGWYKFKDTFNALIHTNANLTEVQKYYYLNSCLKGAAADILSSLEVNLQNYTVAWDLLKDRFENEKLIVNSHVKAIFELSIMNKENYTGLRHLVDVFLKHKAALESLKQPVNEWDTLLIYLLTGKLDNYTRKAWENSLCSNELPKLKDLIDFLNKRCRILETVSQKVPQGDKYSSNKPKAVSNVATVDYNKCVVCYGNHQIYKCTEFNKLDIAERFKKTKELNLCLNCLKGNHRARECRSKKCYICNQPHNQLLHRVKQCSVENDSSGEVSAKVAVTTHARALTSHVFLTTAIVWLQNKKGELVPLRALLDAGSDSNFITNDAVNKLKLDNIENAIVQICGIGHLTSKVNKKIDIKIKSAHSNFSRLLNFFIIDNITTQVPLVAIDTASINVPNHIRLADPNYGNPGKIDLLLGAGIFYDLLKIGRKKLGPNGPILQNSHFGWLMTGTFNAQVERKIVSCNIVTNTTGIDDLHFQIEQFWELEEAEKTKHMSQNEIECERNFIDNFSRASDGKFVVYLPLKNSVQLGNSKKLAINRFYALERKLNKHPVVKQEYSDFMSEYLRLGHMSIANTSEEKHEKIEPVIYYIPHHHVMKETSSTTKLRVVFNASAKTTNGISLNDVLRVGPSIQSELFDILIRFRKYNVVITGDIEKMYRQVWVDKKFRDLQRIFWRNNKDEPLMEYQLNTLTYGTAPASFLATRVLKQLALENQDAYPQASRVIIEDFYMDDLISGGHNNEQVINLKNEVSNILKSGGFHLRKFTSNDKLVLENCGNIEGEQHILKNIAAEKTLGLNWDAGHDVLRFKCQLNNENVQVQITKRSILSAIGRIFDPLGLIAPVIINAKLLLQKLWLEKLEWDKNLPQHLTDAWLKLKMQFDNLNNVAIPRHVMLHEYSILELHGFCDASERAYGCAIYIRTNDQFNNIKVNLLCGKSKVAPIKNITVPRLELCGAVLLTKIVNRIKENIKLNFDSIHYWTDSTIVLSWLNNEPCNMKTFVANRVAKIQTYSVINNWHHVKGVENPADVVSRGCSVIELLNSSWFSGPAWLSFPSINYELMTNVVEEGGKSEFKMTHYVVQTDDQKFNLCDRFSSFDRMCRVIAWCKRFINNCKTRQKIIGHLNNEEIQGSLRTIVKLVQRECFAPEIALLKNANFVNNSSKLVRLNPFLDTNDLVRVGGRLKNSDLKFEAKHPIVIPKNHKFTELLVENEHKRLCHAGPQAVLFSLRERFWPLSGRDVVRKIVKRCIICFKSRPIVSTPIMGELPSDRVIAARPFHIIGLDYCGPFMIKNSKIRNRLLIKSYICVFVCFVTKAVHLELVTDLSNESFLNMLRRFTGRRGLPSKIVSDNGTNFVGAKNELKKIRADLKELNSNHKFKSYLSSNNIVWSFIPTRSPHFGGLHEAAVKSAKHHLKRIVGNANLTYENFYSVICQIEGVLNSRPMTPLSSDPNDLNALSPGHFLIGQPLTSLPARNVSDEQPTKLKTYQLQQQLIQHFWKKWQHDYLNMLQERNKWHQPDKAIAVDALVLLKEENVPVQRWRLGRILLLHPGQDGIVRVVTIKTTTGTTKRAVHNLCPLPLDT